MLVLTLALAGIGFALLVIALTTGSVVWAYGCIAVCIIGAISLLVGALSGKSKQSAHSSTQSGSSRTSGRHR